MTAAKKTGKQIPEINQAWCKGCGICIEFCPKEALSLDGQGKVAIDQEKCNNCGICEAYCPDFAIKLRKVGVCSVESKTPANAGE